MDVYGWMPSVPYLQPVFCGNRRCLIPLSFLNHWLPNSISCYGKVGVPVVQPSQECMGGQAARERWEPVKWGLWHNLDLVIPWRFTQMSNIMDVEKASEEICVLLDLRHFQSRFFPLWIIRDMKVNGSLSFNCDIHNSSLMCEFSDKMTLCLCWILI